jgi:molybdopterin converting factor small subunit
MTVTIRASSLLRSFCGAPPELRLDARTLRAAFAELEREHPALYRSTCDETGALRRHVNIFVNTRNIRETGGLDTELTPGDVVTILQAVSGGTS